MKNARIISVQAIKGGVGKTTISTNLAYICALAGYKVLKQRCKNTEEELAIINYILFSYCEDYFISPKVEKDILEKLKRLMGKTSSMLSDMPTTIDEQLEAIKKVYNFSERNIVPNLLSKEYAITVEN